MTEIENRIIETWRIHNRILLYMLGYYISHEAHHRGSILLTMKQSGFKLPDALKWHIWEWNKR